MTKKTEVLTNSNDKFDKLLSSIQKETAYKVIKDTLGKNVYNAISKKNFIDLIIAFEELEYSHNKSQSQKEALEIINDLIKEYDFKNFKKDLFNYSEKFFKQEAIDKKEFNKIYNKTANKIRNYIVLKFLNDKDIKRDILKEVWEELNSWYRNIVFNYDEYIREQEQFQSDCDSGMYG